MNFYLYAFFGALIMTIFGYDLAFAQTSLDNTTEVEDIARNIVATSNRLPGIITAFAYALGLLFGVTGILKLRDHVENPTQTKLQIPVIRLLIGGAMFALPIVYEAMSTAINGTGDPGIFEPDNTIANTLSGIFGSIGKLGITLDVNNILANILDAIEDVPGLITAFAYLGGLCLGVIGLLRLREHVENPEQTPLREGFIRLLIGGALFSLPTVYEAADAAIRGGGLGLMGNITSILSGVNFIYSSETANVECLSIPLVSGLFGNNTMGGVMCGIITATAALPAFLSAIAYLFGLIFGFWGILKIKDHVLNAQQTPVWEGITRLLTAGAFFALPIVVEAVRMTIAPGNLVALASAKTNTGFNTGGDGGGGGFFDGIIDALGFGGACVPPGVENDTSFGLDGVLYCFMSDIMGPMHVLLNFFGFVAGMILIMIGISRIMKSTQEGAKGPLGFGTLMTFAVGGMLLSFNALIRGVSGSLFGSPITYTYAEIKYSEATGDAGFLDNAHVVISSVVQFMILVGLISFVRGLFIVRGVAEGNQQASMMAGVTHIIGGALAVNLGPVIEAVQGTLGITAIGIDFK